MPMVMRGGIAGDPFMLPEIELGKDIHKMPAKASGDQTTQLPVPADPNALSKPQVSRDRRAHARRRHVGRRTPLPLGSARNPGGSATCPVAALCGGQKRQSISSY